MIEKLPEYFAIKLSNTQLCKIALFFCNYTLLFWGL